MDPYNREQVQAVWLRVRGTHEEQSLQQSLEEMIAAEMDSAQTYTKMAGQRPQQAKLFQRMAREEKKHGEKLMTLYDLLFGKRPVIASGVAQESCSFREAIRRAYRGEIAAAENYQNAAQRWKQHRELFHSIAADEERHGQNLYRLMRFY